MLTLCHLVELINCGKTEIISNRTIYFVSQQQYKKIPLKQNRKYLKFKNFKRVTNSALKQKEILRHRRIWSYYEQMGLMWVGKQDGMDIVGQCSE